MSAKILKVVLPCAALLLVTGCIDEDYDLSDIDTTVDLKVNDLVLPINIDAITLGDIISTSDDDQIKEVTDINGNKFYAFTESGDFSSDPIFIEEVTIAAPSIESSSVVIGKKNARATTYSTLPDVTYDIPTIERSFSYSTSSVDKSIIDIKSAKIKPLKFNIQFEVSEVTSVASKAVLSNVKIRLLKGLVVTADEGSYDSKTGIWSIDSYALNNGKASLALSVSGFDFEAGGISFDGASHSLRIPGEFTITSGEFIVTPKSGDLPTQVTFNTHYTIDDVDITSFTGRVTYELDGMSVNPIKINDLPDFLNGDGTNIILANPQIYLSVNNPVAGDKLACRTGLTLTAKRPSLESVPDFSYSVASPITIGYDKGVSGPYNFVLAPNTTTSDINILNSIYQENLTGVSFPGLSEILSVPSSYGQSRFPEEIAVELTNPQIIESDVTDFEIGRNIQGVKGTYQFVAPLSLSNGTQIVYSDTADGWNDEDVDAITITSLTVTADVTNNTPLNASIQAYPIDVNGNRINNVSIQGADVQYNAVDAPIEITITGTITHLDGIIYTATLNPGSEQSLTPQQTITLKNIKVKVSGSYTNEL